MVGMRAMVHPTTVCLELAQERHATALEKKTSTADQQVAARVGTVKDARFAALTDADRLVAARACLGGCCQEKEEEKVWCLRGCGRGVHLVACLKTSRRR